MINEVEMMEEREEIINSFYGKIDEDVRLDMNRHGQLEHRTTMTYIHRYSKPGDQVLEVGAGTGRYSIALAKEGYEVKAVEYVNHNLEILKQNMQGVDNLEAMQGDAVDLSRFQDNTFDITLVLGPMYHLYDICEQNKAIDEAIRVTKKDGIMIFAFLSVHAILYCNYLCGSLEAGVRENFDENYTVKHFPEQLFTGYDVNQFEEMFCNKKVEHITTVGADSVLELAENRKDFLMSDEEFELFCKYHLSVCEKRELLGSSSHLLYICRKK